MKTIRRSLTVLSIFLICFTLVPAALAHPLGNFTINHYAGLHVSESQVVIDFVIDMAEIPAFQEIARLDANGNGLADTQEAQSYHGGKCAALQPDLRLLVNNQAAALTLVSSAVEFPTGAGGLATLRLTCEFQTAVAGTLSTVAFADHTYTDRLGWREIVVTADGVALTGEYASTSLSQRLTSYPEDLLSAPLDQREVTLQSGRAAIPNQTVPVPSESSSPLAGQRNDRFTQLITLQDLTVPTILLALLISFVWGAMHAMTPGHGKTIVGAYLVGTRGTIKHALYLGLTTTITHTLGVFALGLLTLFAAQFIVPERLYPWMNLFSGLLVVGIGVNLFASRLRSSMNRRGMQDWKTRLLPARPSSAPVLQYQPVEPAGAPHKFVAAPQSAHRHSDAHGHDHTHDHSHAHDHSHGSHGDHSHLPPGAQGEPVTWRSLLALGISGGLIPCPSALVVMLGAIALNRIGFGLVLVLAFSIGLAGALTGIGMLFIYAGRLFQRFPSQGKLIQLLPVLSALFVSLIGLAICLKALGEMGLV